DGRQHRPGGPAHLPAGRGRRGGGGHHVRGLLRGDPEHHRLRAGDQGLHRRGAGWHRQPAGRPPGGPDPGPDRELRRQHLGLTVEGRDRLHRAGGGAHGPAHGPAGGGPDPGAGVRLPRVQLPDFVGAAGAVWQRTPTWGRWIVRLAVLVVAVLAPADSVGRIMAPASDWKSILFFPIAVYILLAV